MSLLNDALLLAGTEVLLNPALAGEFVVFRNESTGASVNRVSGIRQEQSPRLYNMLQDNVSVALPRTLSAPLPGEIITRNNGELLRIKTAKDLDFAWLCECVAVS